MILRYALLIIAFNFFDCFAQKKIIQKVEEAIVLQDSIEEHSLSDSLSREYISSFRKYLRSNQDNLLIDIGYIVTLYNWDELIPDIIKRIKRVNKQKYPTDDYLIDVYGGLSYFNTADVRDFLKKDFEEVLSMRPKDLAAETSQRSWLNSYLEVFEKLQIKVDKSPLYDYLKREYWLSNEFKMSPYLFAVKKSYEDSLTNWIVSLVGQDSVEEVRIWAKINALDSSLVDYTIRLVPIMDFTIRNEDEKLKNLLDEKGIPSHNLEITNKQGNISIVWGHGYPNQDSILKFMKYFSMYPDALDIIFMKNLYDLYPDSSSLNKYIERAEKNLIRFDK